MKNNRPSLFFDSEEISRLREVVQKPWIKEEFWAFHFSRRFSIYLSCLIVKKSRMSPNTITLLAILAGLTAAASFMVGTAFSELIGCFFYQFSYLLDCVDGEVARMTNQSSKGGDWLDIGLNYSLYFSTFGVLYGVEKNSTAFEASFSVYLILFTIFAEILATNGSSLVFKDSTVTRDTIATRKINKWLDCLVFMFVTQTGFQVGVLVLSICWLLLGIKTALLYWVGFHLVIGFVRACYKLKLNMKYLSQR